MELIPAFDPTSATSGSFIASTLQTGSQIIITNKSYVNMIFTFASGDQRPVLANDRRAFTFGGASALPGPAIKWEQQSIDYSQTINQLENLVFVEVYAPTEIVSEKYPAIIQRETLPSLIPYNIGYGGNSLLVTHSSPNPVIWPSSYYGVTVAPSANVGGMNFDHFWTESIMLPNVSQTLFDIPGVYSGNTGKTINNANLSNTALATNVPGPFSLGGLIPVDSVTHLNGTHWECDSTINWAAATSGFFIDFWLNLDGINSTQYVFGDSSPDSTNSGVAIHITAQNMVAFDIGFVGGFKRIIGSTILQPNTWYHIACYYSGTTTNFMSIYINGVQDGIIPTSGTPINTTRVLWLGGDNFHGNSIFGTICNIGILLSDIMSTQWGQNSIMARYLLGQQSLNRDMQSAWITDFDISFFTESAATTSFSTVVLQDAVNPSGLLYTLNPLTVTPLHIYPWQVPFTLQWIAPVMSANQVTFYQQKFNNPMTHFFDIFPSFNIGAIDTNCHVLFNVRGYNILGIQ